MDFDPPQIVRQHARIARPLLPWCEWCRVLHMSAADLNDIFPLLTFASIWSCNAFTAEVNRCFTFTAAAMYMAEGNESLDDWAITQLKETVSQSHRSYRLERTS